MRCVLFHFVVLFTVFLSAHSSSFSVTSSGADGARCGGTVRKGKGRARLVGTRGRHRGTARDGMGQAQDEQQGGARRDERRREARRDNQQTKEVGNVGRGGSG